MTEHSNRLIHETSPYLLQHACNPVDWYPWGSAALEKARQEDKPILLSIGYSACHWCHVMEEESFENNGIATLMNDLFVNIKVDREERPDLDHIYQNVVQMLTGQGGWPLTLFLTPDQEPFYGGTYFPPDDRYGRPGFPRVLRAVADAYRNRRSDLSENVAQIRGALARLVDFKETAGELSRSLLDHAARTMAGQVDRKNGGFGTQPKFPSPTNLDYLLRYWRASGEANFLDMVAFSLQKMASGGIYDQLGGGFHRYSVDDRWLVPHFEKMLYDNAQLLPLYVQLYQIAGEPLYARIALEILSYVKREMLHPKGGFYATQDADSEGEEGRFFVWTRAEMESLLGADAPLVCRYYGVTEAGNWEHGKNILHLAVPLETLAREFDRDTDTAAERIGAGRARLFAGRECRPRPFRDEKILTAWNGLMLSGMIQAGAVLDDPKTLKAARDTLDFLQRHMLREGRLLSVCKDGRAKLNGYLDDYAFLAGALLDMFEATGEQVHFDLAETLTATMLEEFWDEARGGFFFTGKSHEALISRTKSAFDQAIPSGTSIATRNLLRLYYYTGREDYLQRTERVLRLYAPQMERQPFGFGSLLATLDFYLRKPLEIVLIGQPNAPDTRGLLETIHRLYLPNRTLIRIDPQRPDELLQRSSPLYNLLAGKTQVGDKATAYVCHDATCSAPVTEPGALSALLKKI